MSFCDLPVEVAGHDAGPKALEAAHLIAGKTVPRTVFWPGSYLGQTTSVIAAPPPPDRAAKAEAGAKDRRN